MNNKVIDFESLCLTYCCNKLKISILKLMGAGLTKWNRKIVVHDFEQTIKYFKAFLTKTRTLDARAQVMALLLCGFKLFLTYI